MTKIEEKVAGHAKRLGFGIRYFRNGEPEMAERTGSYTDRLAFYFCDIPQGYVFMRAGMVFPSHRTRFTVDEFLGISEIEYREFGIDSEEGLTWNTR